MKPVLSPKELAEAIGVSESSLKRWADDGKIRVSRTAGGHRRIPIAEAIRFIRATQSPIVRPDLLGLPDVSALGAEPITGDTDAERLFTYLHAGRGAEARGLILSLYLAGHSVAAISDGPIRAAMNEIGHLWEDDDAGIFIEHRASEICTAAIRQLQATLPATRGGPAAVGGAPPGDLSVLPSLIAATVLQAEGFEAVNLGPQTPMETLRLAAERHQARLVWLTVSHIDDREVRSRGVRDLAAALDAMNVRLILGGYQHPALTSIVPDNVHLGQSMGELAAFAKGLRAAAPAA